MRTPKVFISHTMADREWTGQFADSLRKLGVDIWLADFIAPGEPIRDTRENALRESDILVCLIDRDSIRNPNTLFELGAASAMRKVIIPVVAPDIPVTDLPLPLRHIQVLTRTTPEQTAERLVEALRIRRGEAA